MPYAVFIVPQGREAEWLFSTREGRLQLADSTKGKIFSEVILTTFEFSCQKWHKTRLQITSKWHIWKYPKFEMMDFQQFQTYKISVLAKFAQLSRQF